MSAPPDSRATRYAGWIDRHRRRIIAFSILLTAAAAYVAAKLPVYSDISHLLPPSTESVRHLRALEKRARVLGTILLAVRSDDPARREATAQALRQRVTALGPDLVASVTFDESVARKFGWNNRWLFVSLQDLEDARAALKEKLRKAKLKENPLYVDFDDEDSDKKADAQADRAAALRDRLKDAEAKKDDPGELVSKDGRTQLLVVRTPFASGESDKGPELLEAVRRVVAEVKRDSPGVEIGLAGDIVSAQAEHDAILSGMLTATLITVILVLGGLLLYYRSLFGLGALSWSLMVGTVLAFAFTKLTIGHLNIATAFLSSIVVGNGINFGILLLARHLEERRAGKPYLEAMAQSIRATLPGTLTASLTASVAYMSLVVTDFRGFRHFGVIGGVGILLCWISAYTILPAGLAMVERRNLIKARHEPALGRLFVALTPRRHGLVVVFGLVVTALAGAKSWWYLSHDPYENNFRNLRSDSPKIREESHWMHEIDVAFGQGISGGFVIAVPQREEVAPLVARLRAIDEGKTREQRLFGRVSTLDDMLPADQPKKLEVLAAIRKLLKDPAIDALSDEDRDEALRLMPPADLRPLTDDDVPEALAWPFIEADSSRGKMILATPGFGFDTWNAHELVRFADTVRALKLGDDVLLGGTAFVFADVLRSLERDGPRATFAAMLGAILVVLLVLRWSRHTAITLLCCAAGTLIMLATASLLGLRVNFLDFVALPITIGIGIDYSVNICARERDEGPGSALRALGTAGAAVAICSYTTIVGYGSLLLSTNKGIRSFGSAAILGEATCLLAALLLAPALLETLGRRRRGPGAPPSAPPAPRELGKLGE